MSYVIKTENLGKAYTIGHQKLECDQNFREMLMQSMRGFGQRILHPLSPNREMVDLEEFWAIKDICLEIKQGERVGIIGRNGAGKSTLLKILSRITEPTSGSVYMRGRIASLLEVGTGFHPELTGRENVFLNGAILGMPRQEIRKKFDEIVAFSEVEKFLDTPVKRYSSGMYVRLAFAVAAHLEPEILLVDEVLAVGDAAFQKKCLGKMKNVAQEGRTIVFVSHNMAAIQNLCSKTVVLNKGVLDFSGETSVGIKNYLKKNLNKIQISLPKREDRTGKGIVKFTDIAFETADGTPVELLQSGIDACIRISFKSTRDLANVIFRMQFVTQEGQLLFVCNNFHSSQPFSALPAISSVICTIPNLPLPSGTYYIHLQCVENKEVMDEIEYAIGIDVEKGDFFKTGLIPNLKGGLYVNHRWEKG